MFPERSVSPETAENKERAATPHLHSAAFAKRLLSGDLEGKGTNTAFGDKIPDSVHDVFNKGSHADKGAYWKEKGVTKYGEQMSQWVKSTASWMEELKKDPKNEFLSSVVDAIGKGEYDYDTLRNDPKLYALVNDKINADLPENNKIDSQKASEGELAALKMYQEYFSESSSKDQAKTKSSTLVRKLVEAVAPRDKEIDEKEIEKRLEEIAPLLRLAGKNAKHGLGAMVAAEVMALTNREEVEKAEMGEDKLKPEDKDALNFMSDAQNLPDINYGKANVDNNGEVEEGEEVEALKPGEQYPLPEIFGMVEEPKATEKDNPKWWVGDKIPDGQTAIDGLKRDFNGLSDLEKAEPFFLPHPNPELRAQGYAWPNFEPINDINPNDDPNTRFGKLEALTYRDSGLLALAGVSTETPQQQAELYRLFSRIVLNVYSNNPSLLREFVIRQTFDQFSLNNFISAEENRPQIVEKRINLLHKYGVSTEINNQEDYIRYQQKLQELHNNSDYIKDLNTLEEGVNTYLLEPLSQTEDKLFAFSKVGGQIKPDFDKTVEGWKKRLESGELAKALDEGKLTREQIRQIEFLSHAVDIPKVIKWIQDHPGQEASTAPGNPPESPAPGGGVTVQEAVPPTPIIPEAAQENGDGGNPKGPDDKPDAPTGGIAIPNGQEMEAAVPSTTPDESPKPGDGGEGDGGNGGVKKTERMESTVVTDSAEPKEGRLKEFWKKHEKVIIKLALLMGAKIVEHEVVKHHKEQDAYDKAKNESDSAEEMWKRYQNLRKGATRKEFDDFNNEILSKLSDDKDNIYSHEIDAKDAEVVDTEVKYKDPGGNNEFKENVVMFVKNEGDNDEDFVSFQGKPLVINKYSYELRVPINSGRQEDEAKGVLYAIPVFDSKGELIGAYKVLLSETPKKDEPVEVKAENESGESTTQETPAQTSSGSSWQSQRNRRGLEVSQ